VGRGQLLTARANAVAMEGSGYEVTVRVVADVPQPVPAQDGEWGARMQRGAGGGGGQMRGKAVLAFQWVDGAEALILGLYVHEYGASASAVYAGRIMMECIDSPPVWPAPPGVSAPGERQVRPLPTRGERAGVARRPRLQRNSPRLRRCEATRARAARPSRSTSCPLDPSSLRRRPGARAWVRDGRGRAQGIVSAILHGYMEAAAKRGFKSIHMHVSPPQVTQPLPHRPPPLPCGPGTSSGPGYPGLFAAEAILLGPWLSCAACPYKALAIRASAPPAPRAARRGRVTWRCGGLRGQDRSKYVKRIEGY
jgi:hypothetical protein